MGEQEITTSIESEQVNNKKNNSTNNLLIKKILPSIFMGETPFSIGDLRALNTYISVLDLDNKDNNIVQIAYEPYCETIGIKATQTEQFKKHTKSLINKKIYIPVHYLDEYSSGLYSFNLFDRADFGQTYDGYKVVILECSRRARELLFDNDSINYLKDILSVVLTFTNQYSYFLYMYLLKILEEGRVQWFIGLSELKEVCYKISPYNYCDDFKILKNKVLTPSINEVSEKTNLNFRCDYAKKSREVIGINFTFVDLIDKVKPLQKDKVTMNNNKNIDNNNNFDYTKNTHQIKNITSKKRNNEYSDEFEEFWKVYPKRKHDNKATAYKEFKARINDGFTAEQMILGAKNYAIECEKRKTQPQYIKMARTFLSINTPFLDYSFIEENEFDEVNKNDYIEKEDSEKTPEEIAEDHKIEAELCRQMGIAPPNYDD